MPTTIADNIAKLRQRIRAAEQQYQRAPGTVTLMAVSKTRSADAIAEALAAGVSDIGESYAQEALDKIQRLGDRAHPCWHFIGPLQSNKTRAVAEHFAWVHSVDRLRLARRLSEQRPEGLPALNVCLQVNISGEASKSGASPVELPELAAAVAALPQLRLRGLMAIPAPTRDFAAQRAAFARVRTAFETLRQTFPELDTLSMGMSGDLEAAIAEGATIVRVGTDIFGQRRRRAPDA